MPIIINGENQTLNDSISISQLLKQLEIEERIVAVSLNSNVVKKGTWENVILKDNDRVELLQFMSGG